MFTRRKTGLALSVDFRFLCYSERCTGQACVLRCTAEATWLDPVCMYSACSWQEAGLYFSGSKLDPVLQRWYWLALGHNSGPGAGPYTISRMAGGHSTIKRMEPLIEPRTIMAAVLRFLPVRELSPEEPLWATSLVARPLPWIQCRPCLLQRRDAWRPPGIYNVGTKDAHGQDTRDVAT